MSRTVTRLETLDSDGVPLPSGTEVTPRVDRVIGDRHVSQKKVLYVLRTALTGTHLLLTGEIVTDLRVLVDEHGFGEARELLEIKRTGERAALPKDLAERWLVRAARVFELLESARARSILPEEPSNREAMDAWLVALRRRRFD